MYLSRSLEYTECACVYVLRTRKVIHSKDVTYRTDRFTLARSISKGRLAIEKAIEELDIGIEDDEQISNSNKSDESKSDSEDKNIDDLNQISDTGSNDQPSDQSEMSDEVENKQWDLESVIGQRWYGRKRQHQYRCAWSGDYEATWEPADQIRKDAPQAVDNFIATLPIPRISRRHQRGQGIESINSLNLILIRW